jgi:ribosomal protein S18 acetylase RimI-like enzyme
MIHIRTMISGDLPIAMRLVEQAGWNQIEADWRRFLTMQPEGCFVIELDGVAIGTTVTCIFDDVAWIAMVLVDKAMRGRGFGTALMCYALAFLDGRRVVSIRLDATSLGQPLYEKLGFKPQYVLARYEGVPSGAFIANNPAHVREYRPGDVERIMAIDRTVTRTNRRKLVEQLLVEGPDSLRVVEQRGKLLGYLMVREGRNALQLGPCIASAEAGAALLGHAAATWSRQPIVLDTPIPNKPAVQIAESLGLKVQRGFVRMCRGREVQEDVARLWASSGPELG